MADGRRHKSTPCHRCARTIAPTTPYSSTPAADETTAIPSREGCQLRSAPRTAELSEPSLPSIEANGGTHDACSTRESSSRRHGRPRRCFGRNAAAALSRAWLVARTEAGAGHAGAADLPPGCRRPLTSAHRSRVECHAAAGPPPTRRHAWTSADPPYASLRCRRCPANARHAAEPGRFRLPPQIRADAGSFGTFWPVSRLK
jgi:hypothetical protein